MRLPLLVFLLAFLVACTGGLVKGTTSTANLSPLPSPPLFRVIPSTNTASQIGAGATEDPSIPTGIATDGPLSGETVSEDSAEDPAIVFRQQGGFMGVDQLWEIFPSGRVQNHLGGECWIEPSSISAIQDSAAKEGFFNLSLNEAEQMCCDFLTLSLTVSSDGMTNTVVVSDGDPKMSPALRLLLAEVQ